MNIGIRLHDTAPGTLSQRLGFARAQGFSCVHLALSKVLPDFKMADAPQKLDETLAAQVRGDLEDSGMGCAVLGCYLSLTCRDEEELRRTQEIYRAHLRFSRMIGAGVVGTETPVAASAKMSPREVASDEAFKLFIRCAEPVVRCAEEEGAILAIEPVCSYVVSTAERAEQALEALKSDNVRIILDPVNLLYSDMVDRAEAVFGDAVCRLGDRVSVVHMKDFVRAPEEPRPRFIASGEGEMYYGAVLDLAKRQNIPITLENTKPESAEAARQFLERVAAGTEAAR
ncbi:MAG: sugar phosphate isomerase/epimerase family protein [Clostridia bacterium]|nr:sugar phosphate isomerase/epimerase family protein [Clostridia bacterium]